MVPEREREKQIKQRKVSRLERTSLSSPAGKRGPGRFPASGVHLVCGGGGGGGFKKGALRQISSAV